MGHLDGPGEVGDLYLHPAPGRHPRVDEARALEHQVQPIPDQVGTGDHSVIITDQVKSFQMICI